MLTSWVNYFTTLFNPPQVRSVCGRTYMLTQDEELWEKKLPAEVEALLDHDPMADRGTRATKG